MISAKAKIAKAGTKSGLPVSMAARVGRVRSLTHFALGSNSDRNVKLCQRKFPLDLIHSLLKSH